MICSKIRAVFFDAVGTLIHPTPSVSATYTRFANRHGASLTEETVRTRLKPAFIKQEQIDGNNGWRTNELREYERWQQIMAEVLPEANAETCFRELWHVYSTPEVWNVPDEVSEVLQELTGRGLKLGLASNFDARLHPLLNAYPAFNHVRDRVVVSSLVGHRKPGRLFFQEVIRIADCSADEILYVGDDRRNDYDGAIQARLNAILLAPQGAEMGIQSIRNLSELLVSKH